MDQVHTWCQLFEERINDWLDERRPLQAELFFDETPVDGAPEQISIPAALGEAASTQDKTTQRVSEKRISEETVLVSHAQYIRQLRSHVESCASCESLALAYADLQQTIWSVKAPRPSGALLSGAMSKISLAMQSAAHADSAAQLDSALTDNALKDTVEFKSSAATVAMSGAEKSKQGDRPELRETLPHFKTAGLPHTHQTASKSGDASPDVATVSISRGQLLLRRGLQFAAVAATLVIAVTIALNAPQTHTVPDDAGTFAENNNSAAADEEASNTANSSATRKRGMLRIGPLFANTQQGFSAVNVFFPMMSEPDGQLVTQARVKSEAAWEEMSAGFIPLVESAQSSAGFLGGLVPLEALEASDLPTN